ncbi:MAG: hypothetical protein ACQEW9_01695 [Bacteroidota bacterium]
MMLSACIPEPENPTIQLSETSQLAQVRDWFEANKTKLRLPDRGTNYRTESQELILPYYGQGTLNDFHHSFMPKYTASIGYSLAEWNNRFGNSTISNRDYFDLIAWGGMTHQKTEGNSYIWSDAFDASFPENSSKQSIFDKIVNEKIGDYDAEGEPC